MRTIQVSTEVFAAIWADHQAGEESEDQILRRKYGIRSKPAASRGGSPEGFYDARFGASWEEGDEIFRVYKRTEYRARAEGGMWTLINTGQRYRSLKELSNAVVGHENAWTGWHYLDAKGRRPISDKRDPARIRTRIDRNSLADLLN